MMNHIPPPKIKLISSKTQINILFKTNDKIKIGRCDKCIHKYTIIPVDIHQTNKRFSVIVKLKNVCKLEFVYHLWLPLIDQPQSNIAVFAMIIFQIYNILVTKWKRGIGPNDLIIFNKKL